MKKLILFIIFLNSILTYGQDTVSICNLTKLDNIGPGDALIVADNCVTVKKFYTDSLFRLVGDTADIVRGELADTAAQLRSEIGGGGVWTDGGTFLYQTTITDNVIIGDDEDSYMGTYDLAVEGLTHLEGDVFTGGHVYFGNYFGFSSTYKIYFSGDSLKFWDANHPYGVTLDGLEGAAGAWTLSGTDLYPTSATYNIGIGKTPSAPYDLDVNGWMRANTIIVLDDISTTDDITAGDDLIVTDSAHIGDDLVITDDLFVGDSVSIGDDLTVADNIYGNRLYINETDANSYIYPPAAKSLSFVDAGKGIST